MKKWVWVFMLAVFLAVPMVGSAAQGVTIVCENKTDFPNVIGEGDTILAENPGVTVEVLQLVGQRLDLDITFIRQPWKRCLVSLQEGSANVLFTASYKQKRKKFGLYPMKNGEVDESRR
ncbi:MAG: hypothetical protein U9P80_05450, partial [Thermodesulfobacteriota bacterium]|nr:hypothetical protein [Thermodesulfobacteriota bacterium]